MKKVTAILASVLFLLTAVSCGNNGSQQSAQEQSSLAVPVQDAEPSVLNNKMTDSERSRVDKHALTLLDDTQRFPSKRCDFFIFASLLKFSQANLLKFSQAIFPKFRIPSRKTKFA